MNWLPVDKWFKDKRFFVVVFYLFFLQQNNLFEAQVLKQFNIILSY